MRSLYEYLRNDPFLPLTLDPSTGYPWAANQSPENLSPANIGQAKFLFSWDLIDFATVEDAAPDGLNVYVEADGTINVSWNDNSNDETSFELEVSYDQGVTWNLVEVAPGNSENIILQPGSILDPFSAKFRIGASSSTDGTSYSGSETNAKSDLDGDGTPDEEDDDTDNDGLPDTEDGWPRDPNLKFPRASESYVLIDLSSHLAYPAEEDFDEQTLSVQVDDFAGVLLSYATAVDDADETEESRDITNKYYNWGEVLTPSDFNGNKITKQSINSDPIYIIRENPYYTHLSRLGIIRFVGFISYDYFDFDYYDEETSDFVAEAKATFGDINESYDTQIQSTSVGITEALLDQLFSPHLYVIAGNISYSEYAESSLIEMWSDKYEPDERHYTAIDDTIVYEIDPYDDKSMGILNYDGTGIGGGGLIIYDVRDLYNDRGYGPNQQAVLSDDGSIETLGDGSSRNEYTVISTKDTDLLLRNTNSTNEYSLDEGGSFHPAKAWNPESAALEAVSFAGKSSDELIILQNNQTDILINGQTKTTSDLLGDQAEDWTDFKLHDINSHGMIVGSAVNTASGTETRKVIALLKVDLDPVYGEGPDGISSCLTTIGESGSDSSCNFIGTDVGELDANGSINQIVNPAAIVIEGSPNDGNVAVFEIQTDVSDEEAETVFHWKIESEGGSASFYPSADDNKGKKVKINGSGSGRVKISVYAGEPKPDSKPAVFTEAIVVNKKQLPYRLNLVSHSSLSPAEQTSNLPNTATDLPEIFGIANIIFRQAGIELVPTTDTTRGDVTFVEDGSDNFISEATSPFSGSFRLYAENLADVQNVTSGRYGNALSMNYLTDSLQLTFVKSVAGKKGVAPYRLENALGAGTESAAYKTSSNDIFDEDMVHYLKIFESAGHPDHSQLTGALLGWIDFPATNKNKRVAWTVAHEIGHLLNLKHRWGNTYDHFEGQPNQSALYDQLELQESGKLLDENGTNLLDYGGGVDLDLLQVTILRGSTLLQ